MAFPKSWRSGCEPAALDEEPFPSKTAEPDHPADSATQITQTWVLDDRRGRRDYAQIGQDKGRVDMVFANAGIGELVPFGSITEEHFDNTFAVNVKGAFFTAQKALPLMPDGGTIILNGSIAAVKGTPASSVYSATKAAIRSFARTWTTDLKDRRIRVNVVSPGPIDTPGMHDAIVPEQVKAEVSATTMGRLGRPEEPAKTVAFLASDDASFITGAEMFVDGGAAQV